MNLKKTILSSAAAAMLALPVLAQDEELVRINGSLIDWYYYGKDYTGSTSGEGWNQQPTGGGAWIEWFDDGTYVTHPTGASNLGLLSLIISGEKSKPLLPEFLIRNHILYSNCGGIWMGGNEYYSFLGHEAGFGENMEGDYGSEEYEILVRKWTWDGENPDGTYKNVTYEQVGKMYNQATDFAYDPVNDIVYGVFNIGGDGYKLGTLDMKTFKITWISREAMSLTGELRTLACNSKGELYGTDKSGNIYKVSTTDGTLTTIGNMGFKSQQKMMSATFDYRTDKMYWLGFLNDGKKSADTSGTNNTLTIAEGGRDTGLYEIEIANGKAEAKLIGKTNFVDVEMEYDENGEIIGAKTNKYGKMQMTGIYVEGSIVKPEFDLKITIDEYPAQLNAGETGTVTATVKNIGTKTVRGRNYSVCLFADGQLISTIDEEGEDVFTENLKNGESYAYSFTYTAPATAGDHTLRVVAVFENDERMDNNVAEAKVRVISTEYLPAPELDGGQTGEGMTLTWSIPVEQVTDGAEDYVAFSYDNLGAWIMYDGDKGYTQKANNWNSSIEYPNWGTPKAYIVMDPVKAGFDLAVGGEKFNPHSGNQYFAAWWTAVPDNSETGGHQVANDDWMISPRLSGETQNVSFWAKGYKGIEATGYQTDMDLIELMRVLATEAEYESADDMNIDDWTVIKDTFRVDNSAWTKYTAELPAGTRHFALQCCSQEGFVLMIDDITFEAGAMPVIGYKVYRNGVLIAELPADATSFTDDQPIAGATYTVVAVYENGESLPSNGVVSGEQTVKEGDVNGDGAIDVSDIGATIDVMAAGTYDKRADVNGDGAVDVSDIGAIIDLMAQQ